MRRWIVGIALVVSLQGCASWGFGKGRRTCGGEPPKVTRCLPVMVNLKVDHFRCLDSDGLTRFDLPLDALPPGSALPDVNELLCKPVEHEDRLMDWCLGHPGGK